LNRKITKLKPTKAIQSRLRVAAYARVSCGTDDMLQSLAAQVSHYSELIQNRTEWRYAGVYADAAQTGTKDNRPEFQRLIKDCQEGRIDLVLTKSISRFARNTVTLLETVREFKDLGIGVYFEEQNIDTLSGDGELMLTILASYAQEESRSVSENIKWRIRNGFKEGKPNGVPLIYGYEHKDGRYWVVPGEAEVVRMIFADYLSGMGRNAIMKKLVSMGVPPKMGLPRWSDGIIRSILENEKYTGDIWLQKGFVADHLTKQWKPNQGELPKYVIESAHEPIIDHATYQAAQVEAARRSALAPKPKPAKPSELSGLVKCGLCGANFIQKTNAIGTKYAKRLWACSTYTSRGATECPAKRIPEDILREKCAEALGTHIYDPRALLEQVAAIIVPTDGILQYQFKDGTEKLVAWQNRSRRESWTPQMRQAAADKTRARSKKNG